MPGKAQVPLERYFDGFRGRGAGVRARPGLDLYSRRARRHAKEAILATCEKLIALGVYPFVVPFVPISGTPLGKPSAADGRLHARHSRAARAMLRDARLAGGRHQGGLRQMRRMFGAFDLRAGGRRMIFEPFPAFLPSEYRVKFATEAWEYRDAAALRRRVFLRRAENLSGRRPRRDRRRRDPDRRARRRSPSCRRRWSARCASTEPSRACGGARGSRSPRSYRRVSALGTSLIRLAVSSAHARGCKRFYAHVQAQNAPLFQRLHWDTLDEKSCCTAVRIISCRPISAATRRSRTPEIGFLSLPKKAA